MSVFEPAPEGRPSQQVMKVRGAIERSLERFYDQLDTDVRHEHFTEKEVSEQLAFYDLADGWDEYIAEGGE